MASGSSRYHVLPRDSMDSDRGDQDSAHEYLLPSQTLSTKLVKFSFTCGKSPSLYPALVLRFLSFVLGLVSFILLVTQGGQHMIAVDVFLMMTVVFNTLKLLGRFISSQKFLSVRIQLRGVELTSSGAGKGRGTFRRPAFSSYVDLGLAMLLLIATPTCWAKRPWWSEGDAALASVIMSYIVLGFHVVLAIPSFDRVYFTAHLKQVEEAKVGKYMVHKPDVKPVVYAEPTSIPEPEAQGEQPAQVAEDLV